MEDPAAMLPDDVVLEILAHLKEDPAALFRCAMACKHWRGLVADLSFLRRCWLGNSFVGFIPRERINEKDTKTLIPAPGSALGRGLHALSSFVHALPTGAVPLVSRHGLLLVRLDSDPIVVQLAVCNLHVGTCRMLPPLSWRYLAGYVPEVNCYAVLTAADCRSGDHSKLPPLPLQSHLSSFFKVVIVGYHRGDQKYHLHTLSSNKMRWSVRIDCFESTALRYAPTGLFSDVIVRRGNAHWFFGNRVDRCFYVAKLNTRNERISLTKLPFALSSVPSGYYYMGRQCFALADDKAPSLLCMKETGPLIEIRGQQGDQENVGGTSEWLCTRTIKLKQPGRKTQQRDLCLLGEKCGTLLVTDNRKRLYTADLETGAMEMVVGWPRRRHIMAGEVVPLEIDWAAMFVSRLGTRGETAAMSKKCRRRRQEVVAVSQRRR